MMLLLVLCLRQSPPNLTPGEEVVWALCLLGVWLIDCAILRGIKAQALDQR